MSAAFYAEDLGIDLNQAARIADFMQLASASECVLEPKPWAKHGKVRVYFDVWSQNRKAPFSMAEKWYYDVSSNDVHAVGMNYGSWYTYKLAEIIELANTGGCKTNFSGAKTRDRLIEFAEAFYEQKANWN